MRYIIFEDFGGKQVPILFPARVGYAEMREQIPWSTVLSAGQVRLRGGEVICSGESRELGVRARREDDAAILEQLMEPLQEEPGE